MEIVHVTVFAGRNLASKDSNGLSDPYCVVSVVDNAGKEKRKKKTEVIKKSLNPIWSNTRFQFEVDSHFAGIKVVCWDKDKVGKDFIGQVIIPREQLHENAHLDAWFSLEQRKDKPMEEVTGALHLKLFYQKISVESLDNEETKKERKEQEKKEKLDQKKWKVLRKLFDAQPDDTLIDIVCTLDQTKGQLYVTKHHLFFVDQKKNKSKRTLVKLDYNILECTRQQGDSLLVVDSEGEQYTFKGAASLFPKVDVLWSKCKGTARATPATTDDDHSATAPLSLPRQRSFDMNLSATVNISPSVSSSFMKTYDSSPSLPIRRLSVPAGSSYENDTSGRDEKNKSQKPLSARKSATVRDATTNSSSKSLRKKKSKQEEERRRSWQKDMERIISERVSKERPSLRTLSKGRIEETTKEEEKRKEEAAIKVLEGMEDDKGKRNSVQFSLEELHETINVTKEQPQQQQQQREEAKEKENEGSTIAMENAPPEERETATQQTTTDRLPVLEDLKEQSVLFANMSRDASALCAQQPQAQPHQQFEAASSPTSPTARNTLPFISHQRDTNSGNHNESVVAAEEKQQCNDSLDDRRASLPIPILSPTADTDLRRGSAPAIFVSPTGNSTQRSYLRRQQLLKEINEVRVTSSATSARFKRSSIKLQQHDAKNNKSNSSDDVRGNDNNPQLTLKENKDHKDKSKAELIRRTLTFDDGSEGGDSSSAAALQSSLQNMQEPSPNAISQMACTMTLSQIGYNSRSNFAPVTAQSHHRESFSVASSGGKLPNPFNRSSSDSVLVVNVDGRQQHKEKEKAENVAVERKDQMLLLGMRFQPSTLRDGSGKLFVTVQEAKDLDAHDSNGFSDPYFKLKFGKQHHKTKVMRCTLNPVFHQQFTFIISPTAAKDGSAHLEITAWDWDRVGGNEFIGQTELLLRDMIVNTIYKEEWLILSRTHVKKVRKMHKKEAKFKKKQMKLLQQNPQQEGEDEENGDEENDGEEEVITVVRQKRIGKWHLERQNRKSAAMELLSSLQYHLIVLVTLMLLSLWEIFSKGL